MSTRADYASRKKVVPVLTEFGFVRIYLVEKTSTNLRTAVEKRLKLIRDDQWLHASRKHGCFITPNRVPLTVCAGTVRIVVTPVVGCSSIGQRIHRVEDLRAHRRQSR